MRFQYLFLLCLLSASAFAKSTFRDCPRCPELTVVPGGSYLKGSPQEEAGRFSDERNHDEDDQAGPGGAQVTVRVPSFALGVYEVSNREFAEFVRATGFAMRTDCIAFARREGNWIWHPDASWNNTGREFKDDFPATCIDWYAAKAYVDWLSVKTGKRYRLPTESEFEHALRAGSAATYHFGSDPEQLCRYGNVPDAEFSAVAPDKESLSCSDGYWDMAPVGRFEPNAFGIHDMTGNVWEWLADCYENSYANAPVDGSAHQSEHCEARSIRGGSWGYDLSSLRSADRSDDPPDILYDGIGFRVARDL